MYSASSCDCFADNVPFSFLFFFSGFTGRNVPLSHSSALVWSSCDKRILPGANAAIVPVVQHSLSLLC